MGVAARSDRPEFRKRTGPQLDRKQLDRIGERLRQVYAQLEDQPLSPRLRDVLDRLAPCREPILNYSDDSLSVPLPASVVPVNASLTSSSVAGERHALP